MWRGSRWAPTRPTALPVQRRAGGGDRHLSVARSQRGRGDQGGAGNDGRAGQALPERPRLFGVFRHDGVRQGDHRGSGAHAGRGFRSGRAGGVPVPRQASHDAHSVNRRARFDHRRFRGDAGRRLHRQYGFAAGSGARHRDRGRRCDRRYRECRTRRRGGADPVGARSHQEGDEGNHRADHRHHPRSPVGVRPGRIHSGHQRAIVPAVRGGRFGLDADLGAQRAHAEPGAVLGADQARPSEPRADSLCARRH